MTTEGEIDTMSSEQEQVQNALAELGAIEKDFAAVELDALRQKEYSLSDLYSRRQTHLSAIPNFWPLVLTSGPDELQAVFGAKDAEIIDSISDLKVERYQIKSGSEGEPRSLRFTFTFDKNPYFEDTTVTKDFEFVSGQNVPGGLVSKPVNFKWTKQGKKEGYSKLLDLAEQLWQAEQVLVDDRAKGAKAIPIEQEEREALWQYNKLREQLAKSEEDPDAGTFLEFFGYRGPVAAPAEKPKKEANGDAEEDSDEADDDDDGMLDVEIFPAGEEVAMAIAEELWPDVMDYFMRAQAEDDVEFDEDDVSDSDDGDAPQLVEFEGFEEESEKRPSKKQRTS